MNNQYLPPYRAAKVNCIWSVLNSVDQIEAACDCRDSAEDLAREMTSYAKRQSGIAIHDGCILQEFAPHTGDA